MDKFIFAGTASIPGTTSHEGRQLYNLPAVG
jgi:hypothetical protein